MSACSDFAEHVWKPGSCKNCFHPFSAHRRPGARGPAGGPPAVCLARTGLGGGGGGGGDEEPGVTSPSPYSKPTIAVKPTMMMNSNDANSNDANMNGGQVRARPGWITELDHATCDSVTESFFTGILCLIIGTQNPNDDSVEKLDPRVGLARGGL